MSFRTLTDYTPLTSVNGKLVARQKWADDGAVKQQGSKAIKQCECGTLVVWLKSSKTGRSYLAQCYRYHTDGPAESFYYQGHAVHTHERCAAKKAEATAVDTAAAKRAALNEYSDLVTFWFDLPLEVQIPRENILALRATVAARYGLVSL